MTEAQERFLRAIADRVPPASIAELHLFPAIRQGGYETGIAVVAAEPGPTAALDEPLAARTESTTPPPDAGAQDAAADPATAGAADDDSPYADEGVDQAELGIACEVPPDADTDAPEGGAFATGDAPHRLVVLSARYRLTLKGADRGKWDVEVLAQADAPLVTVDAVVRGVQRRAGDAGEPERLTGDALRALLDEWSCTAATR